MNKTAYKLATGVLSATLSLSGFAPMVLATTDTSITDNGANSTNTVDASMNTSNYVSQDNSAEISNNVTITANTGGNRANENTGGSVSMTTGNASSTVGVTTVANANVANLGSNTGGNSTVTVSGNGAHSVNDVDLNRNNSNWVYQSNDADISNDLSVNQSTGRNNANQNTDGDVSIKTGNATSNVNVGTAANVNWSSVSGGAGDVNLMISDNGAHSTNSIDAFMNNSNHIDQSNDADVSNDISVWSKTGSNHANENTNGDVSITTGNTSDTLMVMNLVNFNGANLGANNSGNLTASISGNGADSVNTITFSNSSECYLGIWNLLEERNNCGTSVDQTNDSDVSNDLNVSSSTGRNHANENTNGDVTMSTGSTSSNTGVSNMANANLSGDLSTLSGLTAMSFDALSAWIRAHFS